MDSMQNSRDSALEYVEKISVTLDKKYTLPGTGFRFGLDPIIGLIPFLGHAVTFFISSGLILIMIRHGASGKVAVKMAINVIIDTLVGAIPVVGNVFDFFFKSNTRNIKLLKEHYHEGKHIGSGFGTAVLFFVILFLIASAILALFAWIVAELLTWIF